MNAQTKSLIDMALSTATCACFGVPYVGGVLGGAVAIGEFFFDWFDPADAVDPAQLPASTQDLLNAVDAIQASISDSQFKTQRTNLQAANDTFSLIWAEYTATVGTTLPSAWAAVEARRTQDCQKYFANTDPTAENLDKVRLWLAGMGDNNAAGGLHALVGSLLVAYHRAALDWQNRVDLDNYSDKLMAYQNYRNAYKLWNISRQGPPPVTINDPGPQLTAKALTPLNLQAKLLRNTLLPQLIKFATAMHDRWRKGWDERQKKIDADHQLFIQQNPTLHGVALDLQWGQVFAYEWTTLTKAKNLDGIAEEDDITTLKKTIQKWQDVKDELDKFFP